jgi:hypothetical protein
MKDIMPWLRSHKSAIMATVVIMQNFEVISNSVAKRILDMAMLLGA